MPRGAKKGVSLSCPLVGRLPIRISWYSSYLFASVARMAELADAVVSKTSVERRASSSLAPGTKSLEEAVGATFLVREKCIDSNWEVATGQWPVAG